MQSPEETFAASTSSINPLRLSTNGYRKIGGSLIHETAILHGDIRYGPHCRIDAYAVLTGPITLGKYVHIGTGSFLSGSNGLITMGDFSAVSPGVKVFTGSDDYTGESMTNPCVPLECRPKLHRGYVIIGKHCLVGTGSIVSPGVTMEEASCLGALSLGKGRMEEFWVYVGIPAKKKFWRKDDFLQLVKLCK